jgi:hypothetical protein
VKIKALKIDDVELGTGSSGLIGKKVLSRFLVTIDWGRKNLYFTKNNAKVNNRKSLGFGLGSAANGTVYIQSVIENSDTFHKGITPGMQVLKFHTLDSSMGQDYCDYISLVVKFHHVVS